MWATLRATTGTFGRKAYRTFLAYDTAREDVQEIEEAKHLKLFSLKLTQNVAGGSVPSIFSMEHRDVLRTPSYGLRPFTLSVLV